MSALWVHEIADRFWQDAGGPLAVYPRDLADAASFALPLAIEQLPGLSVAGVGAWLARRNVALPLASADRPLRACIVAQGGSGFLFVDASDPDDERRFSLAHEIAHYLVEYATPRQQAQARLGAPILAVLDGRRAAAPAERYGALLGGVTLTASLHLMERTPDGHLPGQTVSAAEQAADTLAFELLAPDEAVRASLPQEPPLAVTLAVLRQTFGLPAGPAADYARRLVPEPPDVSLVRRLFGES